MKSQEFNKHLEERIEKIKQVLSVKAQEYRRNDDALHNFKVGAKMTSTYPYRVLDGFLLKHLISYRDVLNDLDNGNLPTEGYIDEKFGDIINYFILQEVLIKDMIKDYLTDKDKYTKDSQNYLN